MLTAVVIAKNEEENLPLSLPYLKFCSQTIVIDNNSTDHTAQIARRYKAQVIEFPVNGDYSAIRNFALGKVDTDWVLFVDADELITPELASEIKSVITSTKYSGFYIPRIDYLWNRPLRYGDLGSVKLLRLGRKKAGNWQGKIHETWKISGPTGILHHPIRHYPHPSLVKFLQSVNYYSDLRAEELKKEGVQGNLLSILFYPPGKFIYLWIVKKGFLDGTAGLIHAMVMAFYSFLVRGKLFLLSRPK